MEQLIIDQYGVEALTTVIASAVLPIIISLIKRYITLRPFELHALLFIGYTLIAALVAMMRGDASNLEVFGFLFMSFITSQSCYAQFKKVLDRIEQ